MSFRLKISRSRARLPVLSAAVLVMTPAAPSAITFNVSFNDPGGLHAAHYPGITSNIQAGGGLWAAGLAGDARIEVQVEFTTSVAGANVNPVTMSYVKSFGGFDVYDTGPAAEIRTGVDPNGSEDDAVIRLNPGDLINEVWLDPNPYAATETTPAHLFDGIDLFQHELGHALGFIGWRDAEGALPGGYMSTWDSLLVRDGDYLYFTGQSAMSLYGGPLPLTKGTSYHLGNRAPEPGSDLEQSVMGGGYFHPGTRSVLNPLDFAIMEDLGYTLAAVPEPDGWAALAGLGLLGWAGWRRRR